MTTSAQEEDILRNENLFRGLHRLLQAVRLHLDNNELVQQCLNDFISVVTTMAAQSDSLKIQLSRGRFYLNGEKLFYKRRSAYVVRKMLHDFDTLGIHGLRFYHSIREYPKAEILAFARAVQEADQKGDPAAWLRDYVDKHNLAWVELLDPITSDSVVGAQILKERSLNSYSQALNSLKSMSQGQDSNNAPAARSAIQITREMVNIVIEDDSVLLALSTLRDYDDYTFVHSVNVAIHAIRFGKRIGLSEESLVLLGLCGLFHDLGKVTIPPEIINKPGKLDEDEWNEIRKHPTHSACHILRLEISRELSSKILLAPIEHHLKYDRSGYPDTYREAPISLFGRMLSIVDVFDAITSPRAYRSDAMSPDRALTHMARGIGKDFDPILLKVFINSLGIYPVGTVLRLDNEEIGIVMDTPADPDEWRPKVLMLKPDERGGFTKGATVDLATRSATTGKYTRDVTGSLHAATLGIQPAEFLTK